MEEEREVICMKCLKTIGYIQSQIIDTNEFFCVDCQKEEDDEN